MLFAPTLIFGLLILMSCTAADRDNINDPSAGNYESPARFSCMISNVCYSLNEDYNGCAAIYSSGPIDYEAFYNPHSNHPDSIFLDSNDIKAIYSSAAIVFKRDSNEFSDTTGTNPAKAETNCETARKPVSCLVKVEDPNSEGGFFQECWPASPAKSCAGVNEVYGSLGTVTVIEETSDGLVDNCEALLKK
jgi:hypothetical protein